MPTVKFPPFTSIGVIAPLTFASSTAKTRSYVPSGASLFTVKVTVAKVPGVVCSVLLVSHNVYHTVPASLSISFLITAGAVPRKSPATISSHSTTDGSKVRYFTSPIVTPMPAGSTEMFTVKLPLWLTLVEAGSMLTEGVAAAIPILTTHTAANKIKKGMASFFANSFFTIFFISPSYLLTNIPFRTVLQTVSGH